MVIKFLLSFTTRYSHDDLANVGILHSFAQVYDPLIERYRTLERRIVPSDQLH